MTRAWLTLVLVAFVGGVFLLGCPVPAPPPPVTPTDAPITCFRACTHIIDDLHCNTGACMRVCDAVADQRFTDCLASASTCDVVDRCDTR